MNRVRGPIAAAEGGDRARRGDDAPRGRRSRVLLGLHLFAGVSSTWRSACARASLVQLFLWGLAVGRAAHDSWPVAVGIGLVDFAFGRVIVVLKVVAALTPSTVLAVLHRWRHSRAMLSGFREFILRGNVIDLAVAVVIAGASAR